MRIETKRKRKRRKKKRKPDDDIGWSVKQELPLPSCIPRKGYNNDSVQPRAQESCIKANVCLYKWLVRDKVEKKKSSLRSTKWLV